MANIIIMGLNGPNITGTRWTIREGQRDLETVTTKDAAISRARNKWAAPNQPIKLINTRGRKTWIRKGNKTKMGSSACTLRATSSESTNKTRESPNPYYN